MDIQISTGDSMKATTIVALFWLFVIILVVNLVLNIIALKSDNRMSGEITALRESLETLNKEFLSFRDSSLTTDSLQWNYFTLAGFHLPDTLYYAGELVDCRRPEVRRRIETELARFLDRYHLLQLWWKLAGRYKAIIIPALVEMNLSEDLWVMAILEGLLLPDAVSRAKAVGMYQFMPATGDDYGLVRNYYLDERKDVWKSSKAAARYMVDLYQIRWLAANHGKGYQSMSLALSAYNAGPGTINAAIRREGTSDFWQLRTLPPDTKRYFPQLIALAFIYQHPELLGLNTIQQYDPLPEVRDTVVTLAKDGTVSDLAAAANISLDDFMLINTAVEVTKLQAGKYRLKIIAPVVE